MDNSWIKLFRKAKENPIVKDFTAWGLFTNILLDVDRKTGKMTVARFWASKELGMKPSTYYKALKRLEKKYAVISCSSNNKRTEISVLNWAKYQHADVAETPKEHQSNTKVALIQERENKRNKDTLVSLGAKPQYGNEEVNDVLKRFETVTKHSPTDRYPRREAQLIRTMIHSFVKRNAQLYESVKSKPLTYTYILDYAQRWYSSKDYAQTTEKLETFRLKLRAFLDERGKILAQEGQVNDHAATNIHTKRTSADSIRATSQSVRYGGEDERALVEGISVLTASPAASYSNNLAGLLQSVPNKHSG